MTEVIPNNRRSEFSKVRFPNEDEMVAYILAHTHKKPQWVYQNLQKAFKVTFIRGEWGRLLKRHGLGRLWKPALTRDASTGVDLDEAFDEDITDTLDELEE